MNRRIDPSPVRAKPEARSPLAFAHVLASQTPHEPVAKPAVKRAPGPEPESRDAAQSLANPPAARTAGPRSVAKTTSAEISNASPPRANGDANVDTKANVDASPDPATSADAATTASAATNAVDASLDVDATSLAAAVEERGSDAGASEDPGTTGEREESVDAAEVSAACDGSGEGEGADDGATSARDRDGDRPAPEPSHAHRANDTLAPALQAAPMPAPQRLSEPSGVPIERSHAAEPPPITSWSIVDTESGSTAHIELQHPELGPLHIDVALEKGGVDVRVLTPALWSALAVQRDERELRAQLREHGVRLSSLKIAARSRPRGELRHPVRGARLSTEA